MKAFTTGSLVALIILLSTITIASAKVQEDSKSVLLQNDVAKPVLQDPVLPTLTAPTLTLPTPTQVAPIGQLPQSALAVPQTVVEPMNIPMATPTAAACCNTCGQVCTKRRRRCCPPPVPTEFCLTDPCGCTHEACIEVPACCCGEQPCIKWRNGILGRQIATLCWECCDFEAKVIITRKGKVRVRD